SGEFRTDEFSEVLSVFNPFAPQFARMIGGITKSFRGFWEGYDVHPVIPGLFPVGTGNGPRDLFYYTDGPPNRWPLVTSLPVANLVRLDLSLPEFVFHLLSGTLKGPVGEVENPWFQEQRGKFRFEPA